MQNFENIRQKSDTVPLIAGNIVEHYLITSSSLVFDDCICASINDRFHIVELNSINTTFVTALDVESFL